MRYLLLLFVLVPLVELYLLLWVSRLIGFWATVALTLVTGVVGGSLAKAEGLRVWRAWQRAMEQMRPPEEGVIDGVLVLIGGVLLITPGVLTDLLGLTLLLPLTRRPIAAYMRRRVDRHIQFRAQHGVDFHAGPFRGSSKVGLYGNVIETEGEAVRDSTERTGTEPR